MAEKGLWGGRFKKGMHPLLKTFSYSLATDIELLDSEIAIDIAWAKMLGRARLITADESARLVRALKEAGAEIRAGMSKPELIYGWMTEYEDIHTLIQTLLEKKTGVLGKKIHTGRSRNDLVVASTRLYLSHKAVAVSEAITGLQSALVSAARAAGGAMISGYTHLRKAQPVLLAHHLLAYVEMIEEDHARLLDSMKRLDVLPLGAAALAGSGLPIDQDFLARELGFSRVTSNSLAAVSDRAFLTEFLGVLAILWMHLSRLAEDFILWNSEPFGYVELDDSFSTGSSLMPQKKNPDVFELTRGRSGVIFGYLQAMLVIQKGLPLSYNRDLQEDKPQLFDAVYKTQLTLDLLALTVQTAKFVPEKMRASVEEDTLYATDILDYLVRKKVAFSDAHVISGRIVHYALEHSKPMRELSLGEFRGFSDLFEEDVYLIFDPETSVRAKKTRGSTHPGNVAFEIEKWETALGLTARKASKRR
ncbi:MAG: argininosuccinate lyase [Candidatus Omnitrophica bacterium]|nr:argininosuccinate lyase [Candidatus Omnitrophota bacterium]